MNYRVLLLMALGHFIIDMHQGGLPVLLPSLQAEYALPYAMVGLLMLLMQVSSSVIQPLFGILSDKISTRWLVPASGLIASAGYALLLTGDTFGTVATGIFIMGIGVAAFHPEGSKLAHYASGDRKAWSMSVFAIGGNAGVAAGSLFMGLMVVAFGMRGVTGYFALTIPAAFLFARAVPELYANVPATLGARDGQATSGSGARVGPLLILVTVIMLRSFAHTSMITFIPLYYDTHLGLGTRTATTLLTVYQAAGALGTMLGGWMADRWGRREVIIGTMLFSVPFLYVFPYVDGVWTYGALILSSMALVSTFGVTTVFGQELLPNNIGLASGLSLGFAVGTGGIGATLLGYVADGWGIETALTLNALLPIAAVLFALLLPKRTQTGAMPTDAAAST